MIEKFGSDAAQLDTITGGITSSDGTLLIDTDSSTSSAVAFGAATRRLLLSGIENGDFSAGAPDNSTAIDSDNPLPYYTYTQGTNTGITAKWLSSYAYGDGNAIKFEIAANRSDTSLSPAYIERIVPVAATASKRYGIWVNASWGTGSDFSLGGAAGKTYLTAQYLKADGTTTGTADTAAGYLFSDIAALVGQYDSVKPNSSYVPTDAVALRIRAGVLQATSPVGIYNISIHLEELQLNIGKDINIFTDLGNPATYGPAFINQNNGVLNISPGGGTISLLATSTTTSGNISSTGGNITATTGNIVATAGTTQGASLKAGSTGGGIVYAGAIDSESTTTSDLSLLANGGDVILQDTNAADGTNPRLLFRDRTGTYYAGLKSGAVGVMQVLSGSATTTYGQLWAARIYPMNGATASRYIYDDGTNTATSSNLFVGNFPTSGAAANLRSSSVAGSQLLVSTSSRRWKTDIEDVDAETLAAAKRLKARHFNSLHEADNGKHLLGIIAEEVDEAGLSCAVEKDADGLPFALDWNAITAALLARLEDAERRIAELEGDK